MIISHNLKIIFIHVHRTAGTSFSNILRQNLTDNFVVLSQHNNIMTLETSFLEKHNDYYIFGFTRNPWERILSWYSLIKMNDKKSLPVERERFEKFIESDSASDFTTHFFHYNSLDYFTNKEGKLMANQIFRYENLDNEVRALFNQFNLPLTEIPVMNKTSTKNYKEYYTDKSLGLIAEKCKKDIEYFNYKF